MEGSPHLVSDHEGLLLTKSLMGRAPSLEDGSSNPHVRSVKAELPHSKRTAYLARSAFRSISALGEKCTQIMPT